VSTLYLVATPIGNLSDFSPRSIDVLNSVHAIACEDTRTSGQLLRHFNIGTPTLSFHQHNEHRKTASVIEYLDSGKDIALISDAGTPGISDPGFLPAREAHRNGHRVCAVPGPSALITALSASGLPSDRFLFEGFLPAKKGRSGRIDAIVDQECTVVLFESVHRVIKLAEELSERCTPDRMIAVCRELSKHFEEIIRGPVPVVSNKLREHANLKGEFVIILAGKNYREDPVSPDADKPGL